MSKPPKRSNMDDVLDFAARDFALGDKPRERAEAGTRSVSRERSAAIDPGGDPGDLDGRTLRATGRTHPFATRIREDLHRQMKRIAVRDGITLGELVETAVAAYERERNRT